MASSSRRPSAGRHARYGPRPPDPVSACRMTSRPIPSQNAPTQPADHLIRSGNTQRDNSDAPTVGTVAPGGQGLIIENGPDELQDLLLPTLQRRCLSGQAGLGIPEFQENLMDVGQCPRRGTAPRLRRRLPDAHRVHGSAHHPDHVRDATQHDPQERPLVRSTPH